MVLDGFNSMLVNGVPGNVISIRDRGLLYGDGVFRTLRASSGKPLHWPLHFQKLRRDCETLDIRCPDFAVLTAELSGLLATHPDAVFKIIVTRGLTARGYAPPSDTEPTHIWDIAPLPEYSQNWTKLGVKLHLCRLRLGHQPRLAGIKHLNRLENVLAAAELAGIDAAEGLLLDQDGLVIEGTRSNIFIVSDGKLITPDLSRCGVAGVQRDLVIARAGRLGLKVEVRDVELNELTAADALFLSNSVFGLWPVAQFGQRSWSNFEFASQMRAALETAGD